MPILMASIWSVTTVFSIFVLCLYCFEVGSLGYLVMNLVKNLVTNLVMILVNR